MPFIATENNEINQLFLHTGGIVAPTSQLFLKLITRHASQQLLSANQ